jgi:putative cardiolipin synthase
VVKQVSDSFDLYWNSPAAIPIAALAPKRMSEKDVNRARTALAEYGESQRASAYADALRNSALAQELRTGALAFSWGKAEALYDDPAKITQSPKDQSTHLLPRLAKITDATQSELLIVSPYFVPGDAGVAYFKRMRDRGVRVVVLTNSLAATDVSAVHAGYSRYRRALLESGVELYEIKATARRSGEQKTRSGSGPGLGGSSRASLHAKSFVFDRKVLFVGSLNLDPRSVSLNTEIGLVFETPDLAAQLASQLLAAVSGKTYHLVLVPEASGKSARKIEWIEQDDGREVRYDTEPQAGVWRRLGVWFMSWLPIESQL